MPTQNTHALPSHEKLKYIYFAEPDMDQQSVVRLLALMRLRAPKLWNSYQQMLAAYINCKVMSGGGSLG